MRIYDCSNSNERPHNRGYGGPVENACVSMLKRYAADFGAEFVTDPLNADIIFTNDVYPAEVRSIKKPKVKRMDGIFWQNNLRQRNDSLNLAAAMSDCVIFVSEYSRQSLRSLYGNVCKTDTVILNAVDRSVFHPLHKIRKSIPEVWVAIATSWTRKEKRLHAILELAGMIGDAILLLVGNPDLTCILPKNVISVGYMSNPLQWSNLLARTDAFVNFSYRDAAPKVVAEAVSCGVPVLYAASGGVNELVLEGASLKIPDKISSEFEDATPELQSDQIEFCLQAFIDRYESLNLVARRGCAYKLDVQMLKKYFNVFREVMSSTI